MCIEGVSYHSALNNTAKKTPCKSVNKLIDLPELTLTLQLKTPTRNKQQASEIK